MVSSTLFRPIPSSPHVPHGDAATLPVQDVWGLREFRVRKSTLGRVGTRAKTPPPAVSHSGKNPATNAVQKHCQAFRPPPIFPGKVCILHPLKHMASRYPQKAARSWLGSPKQRIQPGLPCSRPPEYIKALTRCPGALAILEIIAIVVIIAHYYF